MKHFSPHLKNSGTMKAHMPASKPEGKEPPKKMGGTTTDSSSHEEGQPHPTTGVKSVHIHHMGGGHFKTTAHHGDGSMQEDHHGSSSEAHAHSASMMPDEHEQMDTDSGSEMGEMSALGGVE